MAKVLSLIIIDTLNGAFGPGDENSVSDLGQIMNVLKAVAKEHFAAVSVLHHPGKDAVKGPRGSSALPAGFDNIAWLARLEKAINAALLLSSVETSQPISRSNFL